MAGNAVIGALRVVLGADTADLESGLKNAQNKLSNFGTGVAKAGAMVGAAMLAVGAAVAFAVKHAIDEADKLGKAAQKWGVPVEELSRLKHAADLSGISFEGLGTAVSKLSKNMSAIAGGDINTASKAFQALNISVKNSDGTLKSSTQVMTEVAGKFEGMKDGAGKTALAMAIFGKSGAEMIPMLNAGAKGLREMMHEADQLGIVIDSKTAKAAEAFNDNLTRLGKVKDGIILQVTARLLPAMQLLSQSMIDAAKNSSGMDTAANVLTVALQGLLSAGVIVGVTFKAMGDVVAGVAAAVMLAAKGDFAGAGVALKGGFTDVVATAEAAAERLKLIWDTAAAANLAAAPALANQIAAPIIQSADRALEAKKVFDAFFLNLAKQQAEAGARIASMDMTTGAYERMRVVAQALAIVEEKKLPVTAALNQKIVEAGLVAEQTALKLKGMQLVQANPVPHEAYRKELENNRLSLMALGATSEDIARVQEATAVRFGATWHQAGESIAGSIAGIGQAFGKENKAMAMTAKIAGAIQATISMFVGGAKALELPFPANIAAMAAVLAKGAALVASIRSQSIGGFATGGSFTVPGGLGGGDRQRVAMDLEAGERVDVWRPGEAGGDPRRGGGSDRTVTVRFEGDDLGIGQKIARRIIIAVNEAVGDGARLRFA